MGMLGQSERIVIDHVIGVRVAAPESIDYLRRVVSGEVTPDPGRISAARTLVTENRALMVAMAERMVKPEEFVSEEGNLALLSTEELIALTRDEGSGGE